MMRPRLLSLALALWVTSQVDLAAQGAPLSIGPLGGQGNAVWVDPDDADVILVGKTLGGLFRSSDAGDTLLPFGNGLPTTPGIADLFSDPQDPNTIYAPVGGVLWRSADRGANWTALGLSVPGSLRGLTISPTSGTLLAMDSGSVYRSADAGNTWSIVFSSTLLDAVAFGPGGQAWAGALAGVWSSSDDGSIFNLVPAFGGWAQDIIIDPNDSQRIVVGTNNGIRLSTDGGASFSTITTGLSGGDNSEFLSWSPDGSRLWFGTLDKLYFSTSGGASWELALAGMPTPTPIPTALVVAADSSRTYLTGEATNGGLFGFDPTLSLWAQIGFAEVDLLDALIAGPGGLRVLGTSTGVFAGPPGGPVQATSFVADFGFHTEALLADPSDPTRWISGGVGSFIDNAQVRVLTDNGANFQLVYETFGAGRVEDLARDPFDPSVIMAGIFVGGFGNEALIRSDDGGNSWSDVPGTAGWACRAVCFDPHLAGHVLELSDNGQWAESFDSGLSFTTLQPAWPLTGPSVLLAVDPFQQDLLYRGDQGTGLQRSSDAGASWTALGVTLNSESDLELHPDIPGLMFVSDGSGQVLRSGDGGDSWAAVLSVAGGVNAAGLALDPSDGTLLVATRGASAWELPGASPYVRLGNGTQGSGGFVPRLWGIDLPAPGNAAFGLGGDRLLGGTTAFLFVGLTEIAATVAGGTFFAGPPYVAILQLPSGGSPGVPGSGSVQLVTGLPNDVSLLGLPFVSQLGVLDSGAVSGFQKVISAGLRTTIGL